MKLSAKAEYACLAVLELALRTEPAEPVRLSEIAAPNGIPERFLVQILLQLKGAGLVASTRGAAGGYRLAMEPAAITLWDVIQTIDGPPSVGSAEAHATQGAGWNTLRRVWQEVNHREEEYLRQTTFAQLAEQTRAQSVDMYYI